MGRTRSERSSAKVGDRPFGYIQSYRLADETSWWATTEAAIGNVDRAVGLGYLIGEVGLIGQGLGSAMIGAFVTFVWELYAEDSLIVVAVQQANGASWRALEHAGFARVWRGLLDSDDPSDQGPAYLYRADRAGGAGRSPLGS